MYKNPIENDINCTRSVLLSNTVQKLKIPGRAGPRTKQGKGLRFEPIFLKCEKLAFPELIPSSFVATRAFRGAFSSLRVFGAPCNLYVYSKVPCELKLGIIFRESRVKINDDYT